MRCHTVPVRDDDRARTHSHRNRQKEVPMRAAWRIKRLAFMALIISALGSPAYGQHATFSQITDAVGKKFFNPATTAVDPLNANRLIIRMHSGMDWTVWKGTEF